MTKYTHREIKFRGWDEENNEMVFADDISMADIMARFEPHIMQFTGLLDKNDRQIYEGDIVTWGKHCDYCKEITERVAEVKLDPDLIFQNHYPNGNVHDFHYGNFAYAALGDSRTLKHLEVVGNIYENKELLT